jgi:hypothetical protein
MRAVKKPEPKIIVNWQPATGKPSPLWQWLWARLLADKKTRPASSRNGTDDRAKLQAKSVKKNPNKGNTLSNIQGL